MKQFSIIIPAYNVFDYLEQCIESVINQKFNKQLYEIIIVNDGSTDETGSLADKFARDYDNIFVIHKKNEGLSEARNSGIEKSQGEYVLFLDSDDFWTDSNFLFQLSDMIYEKKLDMIIYSFSLYYNEDRIVKLPYTYSKLTNDFRLDFFHLMKANILSNPAWNKCVNRKFLTDDCLFIKGITHEDMPWSISLYKKIETYSILNNPQMMYRQNREGSITHSINETNVRDILIGLEMTLNNIETFSDDFQEKLLSYHCYNYILVLPYLAPYVNNGEIYKKTKKLNYLLQYRYRIGDISFRMTGNIVALFGVRMGAKILHTVLPLYKKIKG